MKSKITEIKPKGQYTNNYGTFNKFQVFLANGNNYQFSAKGEFKKQVGDEIEYEIANEEYNIAKLTYTPDKKYEPKSNDSSKQIAMSVCYKGAIDLVCANKISLEEVEQITKEHYESIFK